MPYTTGSAADMDAVKTALVNACTSDGWTEQTDDDFKTVLSKNGMYVRVEAFSDIGDGYPGFTLLGRTALNSGDAPGVVSMRSLGGRYSNTESIIFPVTYHIFTFTAEVYFLINWSNIYQWCAFGQSSQSGLPGIGNWVTATIGEEDPELGVQIKAAEGGYRSGQDFTATSAAFFWTTAYGGTPARNAWLYNDFEASYPWALGNGSNSSGPVGIRYLTELINTQPNSFNAESVLMPIRAYKVRPNSKISQILEVTNARHIRIDNYNVEQIITLGTDDWMVFPYYKKDISNRDGGDTINHTGTFGWAIKKE